MNNSGYCYLLHETSGSSLKTTDEKKMVTDFRLIQFVSSLIGYLEMV